MPPQSGRGGRRQGTAGKNYQQRTDLQSHQPVRTAPGQTYGVATQQAKAQQAMPLPAGGANAGPLPQSPTPGGPGGAPSSLGAGPMPGGLGALHAPTDRPSEPITHGLPTGAGGGPEVLTPTDPLVKAAAVLNNLGSGADPATKALREKVNAQLGNAGAA
jgi:hypothetical protein